jgi:hypothetical protein
MVNKRDRCSQHIVITSYFAVRLPPSPSSIIAGLPVCPAKIWAQWREKPRKDRLAKNKGQDLFRQVVRGRYPTPAEGVESGGREGRVFRWGPLLRTARRARGIIGDYPAVLHLVGRAYPLADRGQSTPSPPGIVLCSMVFTPPTPGLGQFLGGASPIYPPPGPTRRQPIHRRWLVSPATSTAGGGFPPPRGEQGVVNPTIIYRVSHLRRSVFPLLSPSTWPLTTGFSTKAQGLSTKYPPANGGKINRDNYNLSWFSTVSTSGRAAGADAQRPGPVEGINKVDGRFIRRHIGLSPRLVPATGCQDRRHLAAGAEPTDYRQPGASLVFWASASPMVPGAGQAAHQGESQP